MGEMSTMRVCMCVREESAHTLNRQTSLLRCSSQTYQSTVTYTLAMTPISAHLVSFVFLCAASHSPLTSDLLPYLGVTQFNKH